jgi:hypothetical protein
MKISPVILVFHTYRTILMRASQRYEHAYKFTLILLCDKNTFSVT